MSGKAGVLSVVDQSLLQAGALPAAHSSATATPNIDLGALHGISARNQLVEVMLTYPTLLLAALPNTSVITYVIEASNDATFATGAVTLATVTQTGATGQTSQAGGQIRSKLPSLCGEFLRATATTDANGADCSATSMTLQLMF